MNPEWKNFAFAFIIHVFITIHHFLLTQVMCFIFFCSATHESSMALDDVKSLMLRQI